MTADAMTPIGDILPEVLAEIDSRAKRAALESQMGEQFDAELSHQLDVCVQLEEQAEMKGTER